MTVSATAPAPSRLAGAAERLSYQPLVSAPEPRRGDLLRMHASWPLAPLRIRFHRNHAIEPALTVLAPLLRFAGWEPELTVGDYDDTLAFAGEGAADVEVVWLDWARLAERMTPEAAADWCAGRLRALRARTVAPILVLDWDGPMEGRAVFAGRLEALARAVGGVHVADRGELLDGLGAAYFDDARVALTGTRMSPRGALHTARWLAMRWVPALAAPRIKAVVVDLDQTLYAGVLGEDGASGVRLTDGHAALQRELRALRASGVLLGLLSRNERPDVEALFAARGDFPLRWEDFDATEIGWGRKSDGLRAIALRLRIDPSAVLFVDDNAGELLETLAHLPGLRCLAADPAGEGTVGALRWAPGLWSFARTEEDALRAADLRANTAREAAMASSGEDIGAYHRELGVRITLAHHLAAPPARAAELLAKTNQFNLALRRLGEPELRAVLARGGDVALARLEDRLTDSGWIGVAALVRDGDRLWVEEVCVSCRALGRRLEDCIVAGMVASSPLFAEATAVSFRWARGPRNGPALAWLAELAGRTDLSGPDGIVTVAASSVRAAAGNPDVDIRCLT